MTRPTASVLVLNLNGRAHLAECLPSLEAQTYAPNRFDIVVIDNGSTDDSLAFVRREHPRVRLIALDRNRGFAAPYNDAARQSDADFLVFLNNDTRVAPTWLDELVDAAERNNAACAASRILDWTGERIDFAGGIVSFIGHSWQRGTGEPADTEYAEGLILFGCGGSSLISRSAFLEVGGFDEDFFAYFEDVDLGWRLALLGHDTVFAPRAVTYHRVHGTAGRMALASKIRLYERNALMMIYKNYGDEALRRVLPAAVSLAYARALADLGIDPRDYVMGRRPPSVARLPSPTISSLIAIEDFGTSLPRLAEKRAEIQRRRRRADSELFPRFGDPFRLHESGTAYETIAQTLIETFHIRELFDDVRSVRLQADREEDVRSIRLHADRDDDVRSVRLQPDLPRVSIVILTALGARFLTDCLPSIAAQNYPAARTEVILVDNASAEDPTEAATRLYPGIRVIRNASNLGFAVANNIGARAATGEFVVFLNDDTRVHPEWLREMVDVIRRRSAACVGARILDWQGECIDFCGGSVNFQGRGFQDNIGYPVERVPSVEKPLLFACGAAMLVDRRIFLDNGGWDEDTFAYYEDVEFGWRLWLLGHSVWMAPKAIVHHLHHGTSAAWALPPRLRLYERNALRMLFTHLEEDALARILPAAMLLSADRALLRTTVHRGYDSMARKRRRGRRQNWLSPRRLAWLIRRSLSDEGARRELSLVENVGRVGPMGFARAARQVGWEILSGSFGSSGSRLAYLIEQRPQPASFDLRTEPVAAATAAELLGLRDFLDGLPALSERRRWIQAQRQRSDKEIFTQFGDWWLDHAASVRQDEHSELTADLIAALAIPDFSPPPQPSPTVPRK
jgi:GT2 family glycosyltransferase